jgi:phosphoglycerate dehydrogenase-like enzyme/MFS family permease
MHAVHINADLKAAERDQERGCCPATRTAGRRVAARTTLPRMAAFWLVAAMLCFVLLTSAAASPLYAVYQAQWKFSAATLTAVFAIYAIFLLVTLLLFGSVADYLGRRPVILAGLAITAAACALFLAARGVGLLFAARALQGVAVGAATGGLGAALIDLQPEGSGLAPVATGTSILLGLAVGALGSSALAQYGPAPTHLVWWLLLGGSLVAAVAVVGLPETAQRHPGVLASLRPRVSVPTEARGAFAAAVPCLTAVWALNGFYLSLGPSLAAQVLRSPNLLWGGLVIFVLTAIEAAATVAFRAVSPPATMLAGCLAVVAGIAVTIAAIETTSAAGLLAGAAVSGAGFGAGNLGAYRTLSSLAPADQRAGMIAAIFTIGYLAFSVPVVIAGLGTTHFGLHRTALVYCSTLAALSAVAAAGFIFRGPPPAEVPEPRAADKGESEVTVLGPVTSDAKAALTAPRHEPHEGLLRVLVGKEWFSENHAWSEMPHHWPAWLAGRAEIEVVGQGQLEARLIDGGPPVDVVVPLWSPLRGRAIRAGSFGLIQQFGVGVDNVDLDAAAEYGVWVANMAGLNAVPVAEHAVALLLALARRLPEAPKGFEPGHWGEPAGRSLAGTAACIVGAGAVGTEIARRLAAFDVTVTGVRRHPASGPIPPFVALYTTDRLLDCVADVDSVIIAAGYQAGEPPLVDDTVLRTMRPGAWLVNIARGALLDAEAAVAHLNTGRLAGIGLDVFPTEPYPVDGALVAHPRIVATAHTASLTSDYFAAASRRLGDALAAYLDHQPPSGLLSAPNHAKRGLHEH